MKAVGRATSFVTADATIASSSLTFISQTNNIRLVLGGTGAILLARTHRDSSIFRRVGRVARSILEQHQQNRRNNTMGPKTPCGC